LARRAGIHEADLRDGLRDGGRVQGVLAVVRTTGEDPEIVAYLRVSWTLGYHILRRWRGKGDRVFRTTDAVLQTVWRHGYLGPIVVYRAGDPELARFRGVSPQDQGRRDVTRPSSTEESDDSTDPDDEEDAERSAES
jgi:hypothetical protein